MSNDTMNQSGGDVMLNDGCVKDYNGFSFLKNLFDIIVGESLESNNTKMKVVDFYHPKDLQKRMNFKLEENGTSDDEILKVCHQIIQYSVRTGHPYFFNQMCQGIDQYSLGGAWLTETLNTSQTTYEIAPVFTLMEQAVFTKMLALIGFSDGDAIFTPGGSMANMYGINVARYHKFPEVKQKGVQVLPEICIFASVHVGDNRYAPPIFMEAPTTLCHVEIDQSLNSLTIDFQKTIQSHYSLLKGASFLGLGSDSVRYVDVDKNGKMDPKDLKRKVIDAKSKGIVPFLVIATSGTTVLGAYDPIEPIADVCEEHDIWLHVDAAWGGSALMSRTKRNLMKGIHRADSVTWDQHKMMGVTLQCSSFLTRHANILKDCHCAYATHLFQTDKFYDIAYDTGDKSLQCGRKVDALKLWLMWKAKGSSGFERDIDNVFERTRYLSKKVDKTPGFRLVMPEPECANVCFWYIPPSMRGQEENADWWEALSKVPPKIKERLVLEGTTLVSYQPLDEKVNFFRMVVSNLEATNEDMDFIVNEIQRFGEDL